MLRPRALVLILFLMAYMEGFDASLQGIEVWVCYVLLHECQQNLAWLKVHFWDESSGLRFKAPQTQQYSNAYEKKISTSTDNLLGLVSIRDCMVVLPYSCPVPRKLVRTRPAHLWTCWRSSQVLVRTGLHIFDSRSGCLAAVRFAIRKT